MAEISFTNDDVLQLAAQFLPHFERSEIAIASPGEGVGFWNGAPSAAENYEECTGVAVGSSPDHFKALGTAPLAQSQQSRGLRYFDLLPLSDGSHRTYYEVATDDDSHELRTEHIPA